MKQPPVSIVIPAYNQPEFTAQCIASIQGNTGYPYHIYLVDNGSDPPLGTHYETMPDVTVLRAEENLGFAAGVNLGITEATGHVLVLNNDTLVPAGWLSRLVDALISDSYIGAVGPMSNCVSGSQLIPDLELETMAAINEFALARRKALPEQLRPVARLVGFCLLIRDTTLAEVGRFDEQFATGNFEDDDYCVRILRAGYRLVVDEGSFVFHYGSQTFKAMGLVDGAWGALIKTNEARFGQKWTLGPEDRLDSFQAALQRNREAEAVLKTGDVKGAICAYVEAIKLEPHCARNHNDLAVVLWQNGASDQAYNRIKMALKLDSNYQDAQNNMRAMAEVLSCVDDANDFLAALPKETSE